MILFLKNVFYYKYIKNSTILAGFWFLQENFLKSSNLEWSHFQLNVLTVSIIISQWS